MSNFKQMIEDVEKLAHKDLGTMISFRDLLEDIAGLLSDIDYNCRPRIRAIDIVMLFLLALNTLTIAAIYAILTN